MLLGTDSFVASLKPLLKDVVGKREIRRSERLAARPTLEEILVNVIDKSTRNERIHLAVRSMNTSSRKSPTISGSAIRQSAPLRNVLTKERNPKSKDLTPTSDAKGVSYP